MIYPSANIGNLARSVTAKLACLALGLAFLIIAPTLPAYATGKAVHVNIGANGYALRQHDPVAYFTMGRPVRGNTSLTISYKGAKYAFATPAHRALFAANPEKYIPQYGGYCAFGVAQGTKSDIDPKVWDIVDGRLYLAINAGTRSIWSRNKTSYISNAGKAWILMSKKK